MDASRLQLLTNGMLAADRSILQGSITAICGFHILDPGNDPGSAGRCCPTIECRWNPITMLRTRRTLGMDSVLAIHVVCKVSVGVTPISRFYPTAARGTTSPRMRFSFSRSAGAILIPRQRLDTSQSTA